MRLRYVVGLSVLALLLAVGLWHLLPSAKKTPSDSQKPWQQFETPDASIGTEEDPYARRRYRWMRLRNPQSDRIPPNIRAREAAFAKQLPKRQQKVSTWSRRGPSNVGGRTRAVAYDVSDPSGQTILAAGVSGGMWRTTDGGESWTRTFEPGQRPSVTTVVQDTSGGKTDVWYAGTGEAIGNSASGIGGAFYKGNGIFTSTDGGRSWQKLSSTDSNPVQFESPFDFVHRVRIDPSNTTQDEVYAATYNNIFRSVDGGESWTAELTGSPASAGSASVYTDVAVTSTGVVYATLGSGGEHCGIFRSPDGRNWTEITPSGWPGGGACDGDFFRTVLDVNPSDESEVWFIAHAPGYGPTAGDGAPFNHVMWRYDAASNTWENYSNYLPLRGTTHFESQRGYDLHVEVHPASPNTVYAGGVNLWQIAVDGGPDNAATWIGGYDPQGGLYRPTSGDPQHPDQHAIDFHPQDPSVMLTGSDGGVHQTENNRAVQDEGVTYTSLNNGYFTTQFYHVCMNADPDDPTIMGGMQDNGTWYTQSSDSREPWTRQQGADGGECEIANAQAQRGAFRYASAQGGFIGQYPDGTGTEQRIAYPERATGQFFIHPFEIDPADPAVMYYPAGDTLYRNRRMETEPGSPSRWTGLPDAAPDGYRITTLRASRTRDPNVLYYGATDADGDVQLEPPRLYRLDNAPTGRGTVDVTGPDFPAGAFPSDIAVDPADSDRVLVAFSNYGVPSLFYSSDSGQTWTNVEGNLGGADGPSVRAVSILPQPGADRTRFYAATSVGLYSTTALSENTTWTQESPNGMGDVVVNDVEARPTDGQVLAGTHANGVYSSDVSVPVRVAEYEASVQESNRSVTVSWRTPGAVSPSLTLQHLYRNEPFDTDASLQQPDLRTYRYEVDSLPPGPHTFRLRQQEGETTRTLRTSDVVIPPEGAYDLTQPAPNPFQRKTSVRLTVRERQPVRAVLYNTLGQRVAVLYDDRLPANQPVDLRVSGETIASGSYFIHVEGESFSATRQAVLVE